MGQGGEGHGPSKRRRVRVWLLIVLGAVVIVGGWTCIALVVIHYQSKYVAAHPPPPDPATLRKLRTEAVATIALAPLPGKLPLIERPGKDAYGYPRSYVDGTALRALLGRGRFRELSTYIEQFEADVEADYHTEYFMNDSADAFASGEHELDASLDAWVAATPDSFAPYLARGAHRFAVGFAERGSDVIRKTDAANLSAMNAAFALSLADLEQAQHLNPHVVTAIRYQLRIAFSAAAHRSEFNALVGRAIQTCRGCFQPRVTQQVGLQPRWGGSYELMGNAARRANRTFNHRFELLAGYEQLDRSRVLAAAKDLKGARAAAERAQALGENADFIEHLAHVMEWQGDEAGALRAINRAIDIRPMRPELLIFRVRLELTEALKNYESAHDDLLTVLRLDPADVDARRYLPYVFRDLASAGWQAHLRGDDANAIRLLDEAMDLEPNRTTEAQRVTVLTSSFHGTQQELTVLEASAKAFPRDFYAHERLDYALSQSKQWTRIVSMWTAYLVQNPADGRAYYERAGTYSQMQQRPAALADAARACDLGISVACALVARGG